MAIIRWEPVRGRTSLQSEMDRLVNSFFDATFVPATGQLRRRARWTPAIDVVENESQYVLRADLPGLSEDDVKIEVENDVLAISGERRSEREDKGEGYYRVERAFGSFARSLRLPEGVDADAIEATFDHGVLEVRVPKPAAPRAHRVTITAGQPAGVEGGETAESADETTGEQPLAA